MHSLAQLKGVMFQRSNIGLEPRWIMGFVDYKMLGLFQEWNPYMSVASSRKFEHVGESLDRKLASSGDCLRFQESVRSCNIAGS